MAQSYGLGAKCSYQVTPCDGTTWFQVTPFDGNIKWGVENNLVNFLRLQLLRIKVM